MKNTKFTRIGDSLFINNENIIDLFIDTNQISITMKDGQIFKYWTPSLKAGIYQAELIIEGGNTIMFQPQI